jgi:hypothetical protein
VKSKKAKVIKTAAKAKVAKGGKDSKKPSESKGKKEKKSARSSGNSQPKEAEAMPTKDEVETPASGKRAKVQEAADSVTSALARSATQGSLPSSTPKDASKSKGAGTEGETQEEGQDGAASSTSPTERSTKVKRRTKGKKTKESKKPRKRRVKTEAEKKAHARYMRFSRSLDSHPLSQLLQLSSTICFRKIAWVRDDNDLTGCFHFLGCTWHVLPIVYTLVSTHAYTHIRSQYSKGNPGCWKRCKVLTLDRFRTCTMHVYISKYPGNTNCSICALFHCLTTECRNIYTEAKF